MNEEPINNNANNIDNGQQSVGSFGSSPRREYGKQELAEVETGKLGKINPQQVHLTSEDGISSPISNDSQGLVKPLPIHNDTDYNNQGFRELETGKLAKINPQQVHLTSGDAEDKAAIANRINESKAKNRMDNAHAADQSATGRDEVSSNVREKNDLINKQKAGDNGLKSKGSELPKDDGLASKAGDKAASGDGDKKPSLSKVATNIVRNKLANSDSEAAQKLSKRIDTAEKIAKAVETAKKIVSVLQKMGQAIAALFTPPTCFIVLAVLGFIALAVIIAAIIANYYGSLETFFARGDDTTYETFEEYNIGDDTGAAVSLVEQKCGERSGWEKLKNFFNIYDMEDETEACYYNIKKTQEYQKAIFKSNFFYVPNIETAKSIDLDWQAVTNIQALCLTFGDSEDLKSGDGISFAWYGTAYGLLYNWSHKIGRNPCELTFDELKRYNETIKKIENNEKAIDYYPGFVYGTINRAYDTQLLDENGNPTISIEKNEEGETTEYKMSALMALDANNIINDSDIKNLYRYSIMSGFKYYTYIPDPDDPDEGYCEASFSPTRYSPEKASIYLRYGDAAARFYETYTNINQAIDLTSQECQGRVESVKKELSGFNTKVDVNDPAMKLVSINIDGSGAQEASGNSGTYNYSKGFIYNKFPRYLKKYNNGQTIEVDYMVAREIELLIEEILDQKESMDVILGYKEDEGYDNSIVMASGEWDTWKQIDTKWSSIKLGTSSDSTIGSIGCLLTSYSMSVAKSAKNILVNPFDPGSLATKAKENGVFASDGSMYTDKLLETAVGKGHFTNSSINLYGTFEDKVKEIAKQINNGYDVILRVKSTDSERILIGRGVSNPGSQHYVLVSGVDTRENIIYIADPGYSYNNITINHNFYINEGIVSAILVSYN